MSNLIQKRPLLLGLGCLPLLLLTACSDNQHHHFSPPAAPAGVYSITADQEIYLRWIPNRESDLAGYHILSNSDGGSEYVIVDTIDAYDVDFYFDNGTASEGDDYLEYRDDDLGNLLVNGTYYWYAVSAFDHSGNESELSYENVVDVPRPEGRVILSERGLDGANAGYDLSALDGVPQAWDATTTDFWFERDGFGIPWLVVDSDRVDIQDYGNVGFDVASYAPASGWSQQGAVEAIEGHSYFLQIWGSASRVGEPYYAKLYLFEFLPGEVDLDWGYQSLRGEPELSFPNQPSRSWRPSSPKMEVQP